MRPLARFVLITCPIASSSRFVDKQYHQIESGVWRSIAMRDQQAGTDERVARKKKTTLTYDQL